MDTADRGQVGSRASAAKSTGVLFELDRDALSRFGELLEAVPDDAMDDPTPCDAWTVRDLIEHTIGLTHGMAEALRTGDAGVDAFRPRPVTQWPYAMREVGRAWSAWSKEAVPARIRVVHLDTEATFSFRDVVEMHLLLVVAHGWDLARALHLDYDPGEATPALVEMAGRVARRSVAWARDQFGPPVWSKEPRSSPWHQVLRLLGRDPTWQPPRAEGRLPPLHPIGIAERLTRFSEVWSPKIIARLNDHEIKVVKLSGEFDWHSHPDTDEVFIVMTGRMRIEMRHGHVPMGPGDLYVVPRGVEHRPVATVPTEAILVEPVGVVNTGDAGGPLTAVDEFIGEETGDREATPA